MKKYQVPKTRRKAAMIQPIHTMVWTARSLLRSEGMRIPDCLPRHEGRLLTGKRDDPPTTQAPPPLSRSSRLTPIISTAMEIQRARVALSLMTFLYPEVTAALLRTTKASWRG
jgi:hypothetical protein